MLFFLIPFFIETVRAKEEDQVGPQAQESLHDSSTDSVQPFLMVYTPLAPLHLLLCLWLQFLQKGFLFYPLPLAILLVTVLLFKILLLMTFLFPYFLNLPPLLFPLPLLILTTLLLIFLSLTILFPKLIP